MFRLTFLGPALTVLLLAGPVGFGLAGTVLPAFGISPGFGGGSFSLHYFRELFAQPALFCSITLSLTSGLASAVLSLLIVMLFTAAFAGTATFRRMQHLLGPLLSLPHAAAALAIAFLIAPSGMIMRLISPELTGWERPPDLLIVHDPLALSMIGALVAKEVPFLLLMTLAALPQSPVERVRQLTGALGYGRIAGFIHGAWPGIYRQIRLPVFAVIAFASSNVEVALILGPTQPQTLAARLVTWMSDPDLSQRFLASAGALLQLGVTGLAFTIWLGLERLCAALRNKAACGGLRMRRDRAVQVVSLTAMILAAGAIFAGLAALAVWSFAGLWQFPDLLPGSFTLRNWMKALPRVVEPLGITLTIGVASAFIAAILSVLCFVHEDRTGKRAGRGGQALIYLPLIVPQVTFIFGLQFLLVASGWLATLPALLFAHLVFVMPYAYLCLKDPWRSFDRRYEQVAAGLGKSPMTTLFRIRLPMMLRPLLVLFAIGFSVSVGLYLPTVLIGAGRLTTITSEAVALASGGNRRIIGVYAFFQMLLPVAGFAIATLVPALIFRRFRGMQV